ncbi:MAG: hypothetical protein EPGJADBJ_00994 [Saprospiraceae bacterium]|nr:hypothetical protein [Saprospiraceae bacterium]
MSRFAYWLSAALIIAAATLYYPKWQEPNVHATISWDVSGYYLYLPAALIYKDIKHLKWWDEVGAKYNPGPGQGQAFQHPSGNYVMKYPMGQALQFLPWFAAAHLLAEPLGYPADGFSLPYQAAISWGSLLVALLGLWFLRRVLKIYFSDTVVAATLICLVFGTNYLEYASITGAMTHNWLFTLYTLLVFSTIRFYQNPSFGWAATIGLLIGWATLTRPTEIISALIPLLWGVGSWAAFRGRLSFLQNQFPKIALAAFVAGGVIFLQLAYWKYATGEWIVYSYQEQGFNWLRPHLSDVLFSARAGWLVYSPMMAFAVAGMFFLWRDWRKTGWRETGWRETLSRAGYSFVSDEPSQRLGDIGHETESRASQSRASQSRASQDSSHIHRDGTGAEVFLPVAIFCLSALYIVAAWDIWWYGGSLGQRAMVQSYPLWAFPLAYFIRWVSERSLRRWAFVPLAGMCIYLNLWWSHQAHRGELFVSEQMTKRYMLKILGRYEAERDWLKLLDTKEEFKGPERRNVREVYFNNFENDTTCVTGEAPIAGAKSLIMTRETQFSPTYTLPVKAGEKGWLRASVVFKCDSKEWNFWQMTQFVVRFYDGEKVVKERMIRLQRHIDGSETKQIFFDTKIPEERFFDRAIVLFYHPESPTTIRLDDLKAETFEE